MKVSIYQEPCSASINIVFYTERDGRRFVVKPMELVLEEVEVKESGMIAPTLSIPGIMGRELLNNLAEALDEKGIKTDKDAKIEGTLEATKYHLEDMRHLMKLK